jgi:hypothetical protein
MSHVVVVQVQTRDPAALTAACRRLGLQEPVTGTARLYGGSASGLIVHLPGWRFPVVVDAKAGEIRYDNYGGAWGEQGQLDRLMQAYAVEKCRIEGRKAGHGIVEKLLPDGSIKLTIQVGGAP